MSRYIFTEAGEGIGFGHLSRCQGIYEELENATIVCAKFGEFKIEDHIQEFNWLENPVEFSGELCVIDSYKCTSEKEKELRKKFKKLVVIDDFNRRKYSADLLINPNIYGDSFDYSNQSARVIGGKKFVPIRTELSKNKRPKPITFMKNLLITMGAVDLKGLLPKLIPFFKDQFIQTTVLVGSVEMQQKLKQQFNEIEVVTNLTPKDIAQLFSSTDLAITAGGVTMNELSFCGTPFIAIETGADQQHNIKAFKDEEVICHHLKAEDDFEELLETIKTEIEILKDVNLRKALSFKEQVLINGKGAREIAKEIQSL